MELFGLKLGKKQSEEAEQGNDKVSKKPKADLKRQLNKYIGLAIHYESSIIALAIAALLTATSLRMFQYMDPQIDDTKVQESLSKFKRVKIDSKTVDKIKQLQDSGTTTSPNLESGRTNPFTE